MSESMESIESSDVRMWDGTDKGLAPKAEEGRASSESSDRVDEWLLRRVLVAMLLRVVG